MTVLERINTYNVSLEGASEELEGASPTASSSSTVGDIEFYTGHVGSHQHCAQLQQPHKRGALRWLVRSLYKLQGKQPEELKDACLPSGGSYDSLVGLDDVSVADNVRPWQQQHQHQASRHELQCLGLEESCTAHNADIEVNIQQGEGFFRRAVKAVLRPVVRFISSVVAHAGPQGPGTNDNSTAERIINVLTSIPFCIIGAYGLRRRRCPKGRHFSLAFMAVGVVAASYHGASLSSPIRPVFRKLDYYTICYTSTVLRRAAHIQLPSVVSLAALLVAPVKPTAVTGVNLALVESKFLRHALAHSHLRPSFWLHLSTALVGMGFFAFEDVANTLGWPAVLHSLWHCLSALAMGCTNSLLQHLEVLLLGEGGAAAGGLGSTCTGLPTEVP